MMEMGLERQRVVDETRREWMTFKMRKSATHPKHEPWILEPHATACDGQMCATQKMCVRRGVLFSSLSMAYGQVSQ